VLASFGRHGLIALPGSATTALATVLAPLHAAAGLARVEVVTCQAVSGSGRAAMEGLAAETVDLLSGRKAKGRAFGRQIAFNVIPAGRCTGRGRRVGRGAAPAAGDAAGARAAAAGDQRHRGSRAGVLRP
jgi:hypothetical protein